MLAGGQGRPPLLLELDVGVPVKRKIKTINQQEPVKVWSYPAYWFPTYDLLPLRVENNFTALA